MTTDIDTSAELAAIVTDETGSGALVFGTSPTLTTPKIAKIVAPSDSTTAIQITKADGSTAVGTWDTTNSKLGMGVTPGNGVIDILATDTANLSPVQITTYGLTNTSPEFRGRAARGTSGSPAAVQNGDDLFLLSGAGWNTSAFSPTKGYIEIAAEETWSTSANGTRIGFATTAAGGTTRAESLRIANGAAVNLTGGAGNMTVISGTGASRTLTFKTTTSGSTATTAQTIDNTQNIILARSLTLGGAAIPTANNTGVAVFADNTSKPTLAASTTALYQKAGEQYVQDSSGNETLISPHLNGSDKWVFYSENQRTGRRVKVDMEKLVHLVEKLSGEKVMEETWLT